jgi:polo-like kinase 4
VDQGIPTQLASLPVGTMRPIQFNILGLNSQTHKTAYGQVAILPSRALLVDFRESQRRKGFKGDEVILIGSDGSKVRAYNLCQCPC